MPAIGIGPCDSAGCSVTVQVTMAAPGSPTGKPFSLNNEQKKTLVDLITTHKVVLEQSAHYHLISIKEAWETIAESYNAAHPSDEMKTSQELKRAWEYLKNR